MNRPLSAQIGDFLQSVGAPALLLDPDAFERNLSANGKEIPIGVYPLF